MKQVILLLALALVAQAAIKADLVTGLDKETGYTLPWYSGYFDVSDDSHTMKSHYFFFPSQDDASKDPVILWLNGGPGCSSLLGAAQENGPWVFKSNSSEIVVNEYSWNKHASVLYIESPPGVGFSTSTKISWNDQETAQINLKAVERFFEGYSEYKKNEFYVAGESYAGIYVPTLSRAILDHNKQVTSSKQINLKGFLVGNGCTDPSECSLTSNVDPWMYNIFAAQGFFTPEQITSYEKECGSYFQPDPLQNTTSCQKIANKQLNAAQSNINIYNLQGLCYHQNIEFTGQKTWYNDMPKYDEKLNNIDQVIREHELRKLQNPVGMAPPCVDAKGPTEFFNTDYVKEALHVDTSIKWSMCNTFVSITYSRSKTGSLHLYPNLIKEGLRIWFFTGDVDGAVPTAGSLYWFDKLNKEQKYEDIIPWRAWYQDGVQFGDQPGNRQNAGQIQQTEGLTLVTFKGCGHMVPQDNPSGGYDMINAFLQGETLPAY